VRSDRLSTRLPYDGAVAHGSGYVQHLGSEGGDRQSRRASFYGTDGTHRHRSHACALDVDARTAQRRFERLEIFAHVTRWLIEGNARQTLDNYLMRKSNIERKGSLDRFLHRARLRREHRRVARLNRYDCRTKVHVVKFSTNNRENGEGVRTKNL